MDVPYVCWERWEVVVLEMVVVVLEVVVADLEVVVVVLGVVVVVLVVVLDTKNMPVWACLS